MAAHLTRVTNIEKKGLQRRPLVLLCVVSYFNFLGLHGQGRERRERNTSLIRDTLPAIWLQWGERTAEADKGL